MGDIFLAAVVLSVSALVIAFLYRRLRQAGPDVPRVCHVTAAIGLVWGALTAIVGVGHSVAVTSLALQMDEYGPLQALWFTTGAILVYCGTLNAALYRAIKTGRRSAIGIAASATTLLVVYLLFVDPLPGGGATVPPVLALWSLYLALLGLAAFATGRTSRS